MADKLPPMTAQHEYAQLCMQYPKFARRYEAQREQKLREQNKNRKRK